MIRTSRVLGALIAIVAPMMLVTWGSSQVPQEAQAAEVATELTQQVEPRLPTLDETLPPDTGPPDEWQELLGPNALLAYTWAKVYNIPPEIAFELINLESRGEADLISEANDHGLMQLNEQTWPWLAEQVGILGADPHNPNHNLQMGFWFLSYLYDEYEDWHMALTAYNRGQRGLQLYMEAHGTAESPYSRIILGRATTLTESGS